jgi:hypothetical protein
MFIKSVTAGNFGSLKGVTLDFTDGMNIISGPNESAKSTWHAAIVTAICGLRRGRGVSTDEKGFKKRFLPWTSPTLWDVSAVVITDSGDTLYVSQDLANLTNSQVLKLGRSVTAQFEFEGSPDLSTIVGLRREIFGSTASIRQADIRLSTENAQGLQEAIQRAISTAGSGSAAAGAIAAISNYKQQHVGMARANAVKPLQLAIEAYEAAKVKLETARDEHYKYLEQLETVENLDRVAETAIKAITDTEMEINAQETQALEDDIKLITEEIEKYGSTKPNEISESSGLDLEVSQVIADWKTKPIIANPPSPTSDEIAIELRSVADPEFVKTPNLDDFGNNELEKSVRDFEGLEVELNRLRTLFTYLNNKTDAVGTALNNPNKNVFFVGAAVSFAISLTGIAINQIIISSVFGISALAALVLAIRTVKGTALSPDIELLTKTEAEIDETNLAIINATNTIKKILSDLGYFTNGDDFRSALADYIFKTKIAEVKAQRAAIEGRLEGAKETELKIVEDNLRHVEVLTNLRRVAFKCGIENSEEKSGDELLTNLATWLLNRDDQRTHSSRSRESWIRRETVLKGRTLEEMRAELAKLRSVSPDQLSASNAGANRIEVVERLKQLRVDESEAVKTAADARGILKALTSSSNSVTDCEQETQEAKAELDQIKNLEGILDKTIEFLEKAQTKVHRDIAPILQDAICAKLPTITSGRYNSALVDPENLEVSIDVSHGHYIDSNYLSYGTTEQIYLLLRIALIDHLTGNQESCPIICDDITVHADSERKVGILTLLKEISQSRQVIMFSQEAEVHAWGEKNLSGDREKLIPLKQVFEKQ